MDFTDVINDLIKMEGLRLNSIRPGAEIVIEKVDVEQKKITIRNSSGKIQNRYFAEMQRIWDALLSNPMIRVEDILNGSGSSRNQPETIFANLPYVEWLKVNNKKHIAYVGKVTHSYGTLCQMNSAAASTLLDEAVEGSASNVPITLVAAKDIAVTSKRIKDVLGAQPIAISEGLYEFDLVSTKIILAQAERIGLPSGTYCEVKSALCRECNRMITIAGRRWAVGEIEELNVIVPI